MNSINNKYLIVILLFLSIVPDNIRSQNTPEHDLIISVDRIWDRAAHNAFTSLIDFNGTFYCTFRESDGHVSEINGTIRVIASDDGQNWYSVAHLFERGVDLRDPQLSITPDDRIMLNIAGSIYTDAKLEGMIPKVSFSDKEGKNFSVPKKIIIDEKVKTGLDWLWRATWHQGKAYATIYQPSKEKSVHLIVSDDGLNYKYISTFDVSKGNETTLRFTPDNKMIAVVRSLGNGFIGHSNAPYESWEWNELEYRLGGPDLMILKDSSMICATREYPPDHNEKTILAKVELDGSFTKLLTFPSGGDCSYPGLVMRDDILYMSYYSSHEEKTAIYLAKIADFKYGYESFDRTPEPIISSDKNGIIHLSCDDNQAKIIYTLNGSMPNSLDSYSYEKPIKINKTTLLRAAAIRDKYPISRILSQNVGTDIYQNAQKLNKKPENGLKYEYYEGLVKFTKDIKEQSVVKTGITQTITSSPRNRDNNFSFIFSGYINIPEDGTYTFYLISNDGSRFYLNDESAINNDGAHGKREESVVMSLRKGYHKLQLSYFQLGGSQNLILEWSGGNFERVEVPGSVFYH